MRTLIHDVRKLACAAILLLSGELSSQEWRNDLADATIAANSTHKKVLLYFSVPEACDSCMRLEKNVFESTAFQSYALKHYILTKADFSGNINSALKAKNLLVVEKYNKDGFFPLVVIIDKNSKVLAKVGVYNDQDAVSYIKMLQAAER